MSRVETQKSPDTVDPLFDISIFNVACSMKVPDTHLGYEIHCFLTWKDKMEILKMGHWRGIMQ